MTYARRLLGATGESAVANWYEQRGYQVLARNWRCNDGELDLIFRLGHLVVFCEVKTRTNETFGSPFEAVTHAKQIRIRRLAAQWLDSAGQSAADVRFDVAAVMSGQVDVIENAF